jgi:outer membrane protein assembly factor BamB
MHRKVALLVLVPILLFSTVPATWIVKRGVYVAGSGQGSSSGYGGFGSVDWWPMFHHDLTHSGYSTSRAPNTNQTLWTYTTSNDVYSCPAVTGGMVYVGSNDNKVYALNASTGAFVWSYTTGGWVYSSPAVVNGIVYFGSGDHKVYALNASTGAFVWSYTTAGSIYSSLAVADSKVYFGSTDYKVYCLNASSGTLIWNYTTGGSITISSPAVAGGMVYVGSLDYKVYCLNASSGTFVWSYTTGSYVECPPSVADGNVYVGSADHKVYCLNASSGALIWNYTTGSFVETSSPAIANGKIFVGSLDAKVYCLNASTGAFVWSYTTGHMVTSSPAIANGKIFVGSDDNKLYALNETTGASVWSYFTGSQVRSSPAVTGGMVYVGSNDNKVYAFGPQTPSASVSPSSVVIDLGQSQLFTSTVSGGYSPYSYQWYLDNAPVLGATGANWTFVPSSAGSYTVYLNVTDDMGKVAISNTATVTVNIRDVAITSVVPSMTEAYSGQIVNITVVAKNEGTANQTFDISACYDTTLIETQTVTDLPPEEETTLTFSWNTIDIAGGYYTISANATILSWETRTSDNSLVDGTIKITSPVWIKEAIPCNQTGGTKDTFLRGALAFFKVALNSTALIPQNTLITINLYDNSSITIGVASIQTPIMPGISTIIFGLPIPMWTEIGTATVYANCYTDWPSQGGFPHCPEVSATLEIIGP